jgi:predicted nucleic acid-binding protein
VSDLVLDASVAITWCFADEMTVEAQLLLDRIVAGSAIVPAIWPLEIANVLANAERRGRIGPDGISEFVALLAALDIAIDGETTSRGLSDILNLARRERLSSYDAAYLELAMRAALPLATRDAAVAAAARRCGVVVAET